jgi:hypothetical protein
MSDNQNVAIQMRRAKWFDYVVERFDLISFRKIADWLATEPGSIERNEARREQALFDLEHSVGEGEFGPARERRCIVWLPNPPPADILGSFPIRLNYGQIAGMTQRGLSLTADLHISRQQCVTWFRARKLPLPFWLEERAKAHPTAKPRLKVPRSQIERDFARWADSLGRWPNKIEADDWAKDKGYSTTIVRPLQAAGAPAPGRPRKRAG